jgi:hypothetical protein
MVLEVHGIQTTINELNKEAMGSSSEGGNPFEQVSLRLGDGAERKTASDCSHHRILLEESATHYINTPPKRDSTQYSSSKDWSHSNTRSSTTS